MVYGKLSNGILRYAPKDYITIDQVVIENFNENEELLLEYGYKFIVDNKPEYNPETQYLTLQGYTELDESIICLYEVHDKPKEEPTLEEQISDLKTEIEILNDAMQELILSVMCVEDN